ncbi:CaiB/BaiF CoA transferase family protein [Bordetella holmesii]|uniref:CoA-transferase family III protein n=2 Tax=Bordetella holmesii TaxID=35814 RepID=A0A158M2F1_9BORD|nr:CaiB/BaiF CoA-transferase family protein [Bordetella holmesii]AHV92497.1 alpha-methylacyl-CoA racemase [Bordetella holmesii ATCC 51541]AIT26323.1 alpha-methylacyl-CoA racemase [Bordetella holmesii 44057]EWM42959.1 alpha-methylacyl-CoA racemase [Bordetella holmesii 41130]EWM51069.1 alpha-methylacyl-CoA racemase [Bordetella holmesii 70147]AMD45362.1 CoA-transferase [Bordetella holmesii H558]
MTAAIPPSSADQPPRKPLEGVRIIDMSRLAPGPYCTMLLADLGAEVIVVGGGRAGNPIATFSRGKHFIKLDLKTEAGQAALQRLCQTADVFVESFRPGVCDRLGAGYETLSQQNPGLVYCSVTGYGQDGPLAQEAGHDISYLALTGVLGAIGPADGPPSVPLNLLADFAAGSFIAALGIVAALFDRTRTGKGQYVDAAMIDGCLSLLAMHWPVWQTPILPARGQGLLAGGAPYYRCYECADGKYVSVGALEPQFFINLWRTLFESEPPDHMDMRLWPAIRERFDARFREKTRDQWAGLFAGKEACLMPVLSPEEVWRQPHIVARHGTANADSVPVIPRFGTRAFPAPPTDTTDRSDQILAQAGLFPEEIAQASPQSERQRIPSRTWPPKMTHTP